MSDAVKVAKTLTPTEKKMARNNLIKEDYMIGRSIKEIAVKYKQTKQQVNDIIQEGKRETEEWFEYMNQGGRILMHKKILEDMEDEINRLKTYRDAMSDGPEKRKADRWIINAYAKYNTMLVKGKLLQQPSFPHSKKTEEAGGSEGMSKEGRHRAKS